MNVFVVVFIADFQIAYSVTDRAKEVDETLGILLIALHRIQLTGTFSVELGIRSQMETAHCAGLELCAAVMEYLTVAIKSLRRKFIGIIL
jgi:hypothetical protein